MTIADKMLEFAFEGQKLTRKHFVVEIDFSPQSVHDIERTLALEPRHFGAISGMGLIFLARGDEAGALQAFEEVLKIHPHAIGARIRVQQLRDKLRESGV